MQKGSFTCKVHRLVNRLWLDLYLGQLWTCWLEVVVQKHPSVLQVHHWKPDLCWSWCSSQSLWEKQWSPDCWTIPCQTHTKLPSHFSAHNLINTKKRMWSCQLIQHLRFCLGEDWGVPAGVDWPDDGCFSSLASTLCIWSFYNIQNTWFIHLTKFQRCQITFTFKLVELTNWLLPTCIDSARRWYRVSSAFRPLWGV